jgi:hypothetical protein
MMRSQHCSVLAALCFGLAAPALAQEVTQTKAVVLTGKQERVAHHFLARKDCTAAPRPDVNLLETAKHGTVTLRPATVKTNSIAGCPTLEVPAVLVLYQSRQGYEGGDSIRYELKSATGQSQTVAVSIDVEPGS